VVISQVKLPAANDGDDVSDDEYGDDSDDAVSVWQYTAEQKSLDVDQLAALVLEVAPHKSCLVFCPTKKNCENVAQLICRFMPL